MINFSQIKVLIIHSWQVNSGHKTWRPLTVNNTHRTCQNSTVYDNATATKTIKKPPLGVAPTTFWLVLLIYSCQFRFAFSATLPELGFQISLSLSAKNGTFPRQLWTLTYDLDLITEPTEGQGEQPCQVSRSKVISFKSYHPKTHTANWHGNKVVVKNERYTH